MNNSPEKKKSGSSFQLLIYKLNMFLKPTIILFVAFTSKMKGFLYWSGNSGEKKYVYLNNTKHSVKTTVERLNQFYKPI